MKDDLALDQKVTNYVLTPVAKADVFHLWTYIADDNEDAADQVERAVYEACACVADALMRGHFRPDLTTRQLRFWDAHPLS